MSCMSRLSTKKRKGGNCYAGPTDAAAILFTSDLHSIDAPTNCCPKLTYQSHSRSKLPYHMQEDDDLELLFPLHENWVVRFAYGDEPARKVMVRKSATLRRNRPLMYRRGILGSIFHPMRRCPIINIAQVLLDCIPIQPGPVSYLHGQTIKKKRSIHTPVPPPSTLSAFCLFL
ncbi:hypothetical protein GGS26DRAFT_408060 [Hypomontagnella submonticulosa]|nr:hypothetical protein GGS26DRAFT_408060 [Hypomontagnella submonticulosa]